jgi:hypothetical protein
LPALPPAFNLSGLTFNPTQVEVNKPVTVSVNMKNLVDLSGNYTAELKVNGVTEDTKIVTIAGGGEIVVSFTVTKMTAGSYHAARADKQNIYSSPIWIL